MKNKNIYFSKLRALWSMPPHRGGMVMTKNADLSSDTKIGKFQKWKFPFLENFNRIYLTKVGPMRNSDMTESWFGYKTQILSFPNHRKLNTKRENSVGLFAKLPREHSLSHVIKQSEHCINFGEKLNLQS